MTGAALGDHAGQIRPRHMATLTTGFDHAGEQGPRALGGWGDGSGWWDFDAAARGPL